MSCACGKCDYCLDFGPDIAGCEFDTATIEQCESNATKWGDNTTQLLMIVLMEEVGEIARALLEKSSVEHLRSEIIDASSVLRQLYIQVNDDEK